MFAEPFEADSDASNLGQRLHAANIARRAHTRRSPISWLLLLLYALIGYWLGTTILTLLEIYGSVGLVTRATVLLLGIAAGIALEQVVFVAAFLHCGRGDARTIVRTEPAGEATVILREKDGWTLGYFFAAWPLSKGVGTRLGADVRAAAWAAGGPMAGDAFGPMIKVYERQGFTVGRRALLGLGRRVEDHHGPDPTSGENRPSEES